MPKFDERVNETQMWLNVTYEKNPKWSHVEMDGKTGWPTIRGLIRALQIEIGISEPNGYFGPATESACPTLRKNLDSKDKRLQRLVYILQGAMWCKGFSPGGFTGTFGPKTEEGVKKFQQSAGLSGSEVNGIVDKKTFKALLNMDAYVLVPEGDPKIREIQKNLNRDYYKWIGLRPTDGRYARDTCKALIYALQVEGGVSGPNGVFGPGTQASLPVLAPGSKNADYVRILQYCLYCNGFDPTGFTGVFGNGTLATLKKFQSFHGLTPDGYCGKQTWMSLLLSHGDRDRKGQAFDCATPLNQARINTLKAHGYKYAGRYIAGGESKRVTIPEIELILKNNMKWFPIFQKSGNHLSYFNSIQGNLDATECLINAKEYKIPSGSTIYFAVDFDAMDGEVSSNIIPYFRAIHNTFSSNNPHHYKIGVYGARNICSRVSNAGYAETSFVGDLASGFSGNLGYPLPKNWAFDQIKEYTIGSGDGAIAIDNDLYSGRDSGIDHLYSGRDNDIVSIIKELYDEAITYFRLSSPIHVESIKDTNMTILNFLRQFKYNGLKWGATLGLPDPYGFNEHIEKNKPELFKEIYDYIKNEKNVKTEKAYINGEPIDLPHLAATTQGYISSLIMPDFWTGWGGDLATAMKNVTSLKSEKMKDKGLDEIADLIIGHPDSSFSSFSRIDMTADIDALSLASNIHTKDLSSLLNDYYLHVNSGVRRSLILKDLKSSNNTTLDKLSNNIYLLMTGSSGFEYLGTAGELALKRLAGNPKDDVIKATCKAFAKYILNEL